MPEFTSSDLLVQGDLATAITNALILSALGEKPSFEKAGTATMISIVARLISKSFPETVNANGVITDPSTSNAVVVGVCNALFAFSMKRNVAKTVALGIAADLSGDRLLTMMKFVPSKSIFGSTDAAGTTASDPVDGTSTTGGPN